MDEAKINQLKYPELLTYAKELGINNYGKYTGKPTKEIIMEKIKEHFDTLEEQQQQQQRVTAKVNANKTPKKATEVLRTVRLSPPEQPQPRQSKRQNGATTAVATTSTTPSKLAKKKVEQQLHQALDNESSKDQKEDKEQEEETRKATKKTKKSSKKREETATGESESSGKKLKKTKVRVEAQATKDEEEEAAATASMPEKASRRKHAVVTYKEIDAKTKLRNDTEVKHKSKKASTKEDKESKSEDGSNGAVAAANEATTSANCDDNKKEKAAKRLKKRAVVAQNSNDADADMDKDLDEKKKSKKLVKKKKSSSKLKDVADKQNAEALEELPPTTTATAMTITDQEQSSEHRQKVKKQSKTKISSRKQQQQQASLDSPLEQQPPTLVSRFLQNENNLHLPSPSTHELVIYESPLNIVNEQETPIEHEVANTIAAATTTPKPMTTTTTLNNTTLNKSKTVSAHNTPAVNNNEDEVDEKDLSEEIRLEFNEDEDEEEEEEEQQQQEKEKEEVPQVNYFVLTDDEEEEDGDEEKENKENDRELNITVDKSLCVAAPALPCTSFYKSSNITSPPPSTSAQANAPTTTTTTTTIDEPANAVSEVVKPKPTISAGTGPRIVRPTQKVDTVETVLVTAGKTSSSLVATEQVVKKVVEVVNREAGPRIVKPCASTVSGMDEEAKAATAAAPAKKILSKVKPKPDFKAIHERDANKLESIDDFAKRKASQATKATKATTKSPHIAKQMSLAAMPTTSKADHVDNASKPSLAKTPMSKFTSRVRNYLSSGSGSSSASAGNGCVNNAKTSKEIKEGNTPKVVKSSNAGPFAAMQSMASNVMNTFIPRFKNNTSKDPSTPKQSSTETATTAKTPSNQSAVPPKTPTNKPSVLSNLLQSAKKSAMKTSLGANGEAPSMSTLLASSSFIRRKSYDLNRSLSKQLSYKPHAGKIKPFDIEAKTALFKSSLNTNLNETKVVDKTTTATNNLNVAVKMNLEKRTSSIFKSGRVEKKSSRDNTKTKKLSKDEKKEKKRRDDNEINGSDENRNPLVA